MTDISGRSGTTTAPNALPVTPDPIVDESTGNRRRKLMLVGAGVAGLILLLAGYFLLSGGSGNPAPAAPAVQHVAADAPPTASTTTASPAAVAPKKALKAIGRDPFGALVSQPVTADSPAGAAAASSSTTGTSSQGTGSGTGGTSGSDGPAGTANGTGTGTGTGTGAGGPTPPAPPAPVWVKLDRIQNLHSASFTVGFSNGTSKYFPQIGKESQGDAASVFAKFFQLQSVQGHYVTMKYGDGTPFDLHVGFRHRYLVP
jgi:hypothetical protein